MLTVEVLEGRRPVVDVPVTRVVEGFIGLSAIMELEALRQLIGGERDVSGVFLSVDPHHEAVLYSRLKASPAVAGVSITTAALESFRRTLGENLGLLVTFKRALRVGHRLRSGLQRRPHHAVGAAARPRELAGARLHPARDLRHPPRRADGLTFLAMPVGAAAGAGLAALTLLLYDNELIRIPLVIEPATFAWSMITVLVAAALSAALVRRRLDRLDLVAVLKTRE